MYTYFLKFSYCSSSCQQQNSKTHEKLCSSFATIARVLEKVTRNISPTTEPSAKISTPLKDPNSMSIKELKAAISEAGLEKQMDGLIEKGEFIKLLQSTLSQPIAATPSPSKR